jgi:hypothetical protein
MDLTDLELEILKDMLDEWADKDRHGLLESEWSYDKEAIAATDDLHVKVVAVARARNIWWAR